MRQIIFDTETTGMNKGASYDGETTVASGHRIIEIGCVELINRKPTGNHFHCYLQPDREVDPEAISVHGLDDEFLMDKPRFADIAGELWAYLDGADELIAHNMRFDQTFFDEELRLLGESNTLADRYTLVDSLAIAKKEHPGQRNNLDALCKRYNVDNTNRDLHGALLDAELLAEVYLRMTGGQSALMLDMEEAPNTISRRQQATNQISNNTAEQAWLSVRVSAAEQAENQRIIDSIKPKA
ncbi:DNA polymerase III subunit epsilon [Cardiobacteriaceae bacterium TAE3-ERU3]|nr:DNA polymerase III subunit epsilon [Cardiobacteriaceae bacterium TAE3-ERU3]